MTFGAVGRESVSWDKGAATSVPHAVVQHGKNPTGNHIWSLNQEGQTAVVEANAWGLVSPELFYFLLLQ